MTVPFKDFSPELIAKLEWWYRHTVGVGIRPVHSSELEAFYNYKPRREVGSDIQFELNIPCLRAPRWIPPNPDPSGGIIHICGKWMRDNPTMRKDNVVRFESIERAEALLRFQANKHQSGHVVSLDIAKPTTHTCTITELPTEITQEILSYVLNTGCAYQFFLGRCDSEKVHCVQKFVPESRKQSPTSGSTDLAVARTCRRLRDEAHMLFYSKNAFVFHLTTCAIRPETRIEQHMWKRITAWTRVIPSYDSPAGLGPLTSLAVSYLRNVALIVSIPPDYTFADVQTLSASMENASAILQRSENLRRLIIDFPEPRETMVVRGEMVLVVETLQIQLKSRQLSLVSLPPTIRERAQAKIMKPFFGKELSVKAEELWLGKWMSGESRTKLRVTFKGHEKNSVAAQARDEGDERDTKRQRL